MVTLREAAQQALEALERADKISGYPNNAAAIKALRQALEAEHSEQQLNMVQQDEPVAWQYRMRPDWGSKKDCWGPWQDCTMEQAAMYRRVPLLHDWAYESRTLYTRQQPAIPHLDSVVKALTDYCNTGEIDCADDLLAGVLYATDLERQPARQPLTDEQIDAAVAPLYRDSQAQRMGRADDIATARAIESAHGIK